MLTVMGRVCNGAATLGCLMFFVSSAVLNYPLYYSVMAGAGVLAWGYCYMRSFD